MVQNFFLYDVKKFNVWFVRRNGTNKWGKLLLEKQGSKKNLKTIQSKKQIKYWES